MKNLKNFLNESQDPKAVEKILGKVNELLTTGEEIEYVAVQKKPAVNLSPDCIALTNKRVIFCRPKTLGLSMVFDDYLWKDVADCHMKEGVLGATFLVNTIKKQMVKMDYLPKNQARKLYRFAQEREEEMVEYRRERELENARAAAGGIVIQPEATPLQATEKKTPEADPMEALTKLKQLFENDLLTQAEFDTKKAEILGRL